MSLHVICPGCLKRFQVGERFAGMKGPCPKCGTLIEIPTESVKFQDSDNSQPEIIKKPDVARVIPRLHLEFCSVWIKRYALGVLGVLLLTFLLACIPMYDVLRSLIGILGLCLIAFPLVLFGYQTMRDRELIFAFTGEELYLRAGIVAAGYVILWLILEHLLVAIRGGDVFVSWFYFVACAGLATSLTVLTLAMRAQNAFLHYCLFGFSVILCRFLFGLGWFWESGKLTGHSTAPPQPFLPGM